MNYPQHVVDYAIDNKVSLAQAFQVIIEAKLLAAESECFKLKSDAESLYDEHA